MYTTRNTKKYQWLKETKAPVAKMEKAEKLPFRMTENSAVSLSRTLIAVHRYENVAFVFRTVI